MEKLGAALAVKPVLPPLVSEPSKHDSGSLLHLGYADRASVECPGENFCCCIGTTCVRDAAPLSFWDHYHLGQSQYRY
jgi:hypothetical protein